MISIKLSGKKKMRNSLFVALLIFILLIIRVGYIQFVQGKELQELAYEQARIFWL